MYLKTCDKCLKCLHKLNCILRPVLSARSPCQAVFAAIFSMSDREKNQTNWKLCFEVKSPCNPKLECYSIKESRNAYSILTWRCVALWRIFPAVGWSCFDMNCKQLRHCNIFSTHIYKFQTISCYCRDKSFQINYFQLQAMQKLAETTTHILKDIKVVRQLWGLAKFERSYEIVPPRL